MNLAQLQSGTKKQPANQKTPNKQTNNTLPSPDKKRNPKQTLKKKREVTKKGSNRCLQLQIYKQ